MTLGNNIKYYRQLAGLTQVELAEKTGLKQYALTKYERDLHKPNPDQIKSIAEALGVSLDLLFGEKPRETKTTELKKSSREGKLVEAFRKLSVNEQKVLVKQIQGMGK